MAQIVEETGAAAGTVKARLARGRAALAPHLREAVEPARPGPAGPGGGRAGHGGGPVDHSSSRVEHGSPGERSSGPGERNGGGPGEYDSGSGERGGGQEVASV